MRTCVNCSYGYLPRRPTSTTCPRCHARFNVIKAYTKSAGVKTFQDLKDRTVTSPDTGCWLWQLGDNGMGYGLLRYGGNRKKVLAHRLSWAFHYGIPIPHPSVLILHKCDTPACINPDHLFDGTHADNTQDMLRKGRGKIGRFCTTAKLTEEAVREIRARKANGESGASIARDFDLHFNYVSLVVTGRRWAHVV